MQEGNKEDNEKNKQQEGSRTRKNKTKKDSRITDRSKTTQTPSKTINNI